MEKVEYGDVNKFLVSIGVVLIGLSFLVPYLYLKEDFGVYVEAAKVAKLPESVQSLFQDKQQKVSFIQQWLPFGSGFLFLTGVVSVGVGLRRWFVKQRAIDDKLKKENQKLDLEIKSLTPVETVEKAIQEDQEIQEAERIEREVELDLETEVVGPIINERHVPIRMKYLEVENRVYQLFNKFQSPNFEVLLQQRLGNKYDIDMLLKARSEKFSDRIIEIKYFRSQIVASVLLQTILQLSTILSYYKETFGKSAVPVLLVIYENSLADEKDIIRIKQQVRELSEGIKMVRRLKIEFIRVDEIEQFEVKVLLKANTTFSIRT